MLCGTSISNAWYIHQKWGNGRMDLLKFREKIIDFLLDDNTSLPQRPQRNHTHFLQKLEGVPRKARKRCTECYKLISAQQGSAIAKAKTGRVMTFCPRCEGQPALCIKCFESVHTVHKNK